MSSSPTFAHYTLNVISPRPSLSNTLNNSESPSSDKLSSQISYPPSSYIPPRHDPDADEQTLVNEARTFTSTPTPITPILQPYSLRNPDALRTSIHAGANHRNTMHYDRFSITIAIVCGTITVLGLGAVFGLGNISLGCLTRNSSMKTCEKLGAAGGTFASIPAALATFLVWYIHKRTASLWVHTACTVFVIFPVICFGFSFLSAFIGWHVLNSTGSVEFDLHSAFVFAAIGSACTFILYSFLFGYLVIITMD